MAIATIASTLALCASISFAYDGTLNLSATSEPVKAGETAKVTVSLDTTAADGLWALTTDFEFPEGFVVPKIADATGCVLVTADNAINTQVVTGTNMYRFDWSDTFMDNEATAVTNTGKLFTLDVTVPADAAPGKYEIKLNKDALYVIDCYWGEYDLAFTETPYITVVADEPTTVAKYFAASFTPGVKSAANNAIKFLFQDGEKTGSTAVKYGATIENLESVVTAVEVKDVPADSALELVGTEWTTVE